MFVPGTVLAQQQFPRPDTYLPSIEKFQQAKHFFDDPRPVLKTWNYKTMLPKVLSDALTYDVGAMKSGWAELVGFKAPDIVGKIHPEIKPGKYTYKDVQNNPAFKELMWKTLYDRIKPGGPPLAANVPEFEIVPTQQYYWSLPIVELTKKNLGKTKLDAAGYVKWQTWEGGIPFPKPSGPQKAQQILYNWIYRCDKQQSNGTNFADSRGFDKNLKQDSQGLMQYIAVGLAGRAILPPYGWYDENAKARGEAWALSGQTVYPREAAGTMIMNIYYLDPMKPDTSFIYLPSMRRVRKLSTTDTQDPLPLAGLVDMIGDDQNSFTQKISPTVYPYKIELIAEREYLVFSPDIDGSEYLTSKNLEYRNTKFERRPIYVLQLTSLDKNYVYSKRILYIDKEFFLIHQTENYDKKGRLYRSCYSRPAWYGPYIGQMGWSNYQFYFDYVDLHSTIYMDLEVPANYTREDLMRRLTTGAVK